MTLLFVDLPVGAPAFRASFWTSILPTASILFSPHFKLWQIYSASRLLWSRDVPCWSAAEESNSSGDSCMVLRVPSGAAAAEVARPPAAWQWNAARPPAKPELPDDDELLIETREWGRLLPLRCWSRDARDARNFTAVTDRTKW